MAKDSWPNPTYCIYARRIPKGSPTLPPPLPPQKASKIGEGAEESRRGVESEAGRCSQEAVEHAQLRDLERPCDITRPAIDERIQKHIEEFKAVRDTASKEQKKLVALQFWGALEFEGLRAYTKVEEKKLVQACTGPVPACTSLYRPGQG